MKLICSKCGLTNDRAPQRYCSGCHMIYMRGWRKRHCYVSRETIVPHRVPETSQTENANERAAGRA